MGIGIGRCVVVLVVIYTATAAASLPMAAAALPQTMRPVRRYVPPVLRPLAIVTLASNDAYLESARVLFCSLRDARTLGVTYDTRIMVPRGFHMRAAEWFESHEIIPTPHAATPREVSFLKFHLWTLDSWERVLFIDSDALVLNATALMSALRALPSTVAIAAAPDPAPPDTINSGLLFIRPNRSIAARLDAMRRDSDRTDQDTINRMFQRGWYGTRAMLPARFNWHAWLSAADVPAPLVHSDRSGEAAVAVVHYSGERKPWLYVTPQQRAMLSERWKEIMRPWWSVHGAMCRDS